MSIFTVSNSWYKSQGTADFSKKNILFLVPMSTLLSLLRMKLFQMFVLAILLYLN